MRKEIADLWIADLRNPENKQTTGVLFDGTGYCCLGRLCVVMGRTFHKNPKLLTWNVAGTRATHVLPEAVKIEAGMRSETGKLHSDGDTFLELVELNDDGSTFPEIADIIEQSWER